MYTILVYDTATERNAAVLRTCRKYLHHMQNSVFEGHLTSAQLVRLRHELRARTNPDHNHILVYAFPPGATPERQAWARPETGPHDIL